MKKINLFLLLICFLSSYGNEREKKNTIKILETESSFIISISKSARTIAKAILPNRETMFRFNHAEITVVANAIIAFAAAGPIKSSTKTTATPLLLGKYSCLNSYLLRKFFKICS